MFSSLTSVPHNDFVVLTDQYADILGNQRELFAKLGLQHGVRDKRNKQILLVEKQPLQEDLGFEFYPLTPQESVFIQSINFVVPKGIGKISGSALDGDKKCAVASAYFPYGTKQDLWTKEEAQVISSASCNMITAKVKEFNGNVYLVHEDNDMRYVVLIVVPFPTLIAKHKHVAGLKSWLESLFNQTAKERIDALENQVTLLWSVLQSLPGLEYAIKHAIGKSNVKPINLP